MKKKIVVDVSACDVCGKDTWACGSLNGFECGHLLCSKHFERIPDQRITKAICGVCSHLYVPRALNYQKAQRRKRRKEHELRKIS